jgi:hypothetical protein
MGVMGVVQMSYDDGYETIEISEEDMSEAQKLIVEGFIREGEFKTRAALINMLIKDIDSYLDEVDYEPNLDWVNGVRYAIHIIREAKLNGLAGD